jgi:hypothetical protein
MSDLRKARGNRRVDQVLADDIRSTVIEVHDALQEEMKRRLRAELGDSAS